LLKKLFKKNGVDYVIVSVGVKVMTSELGDRTETFQPFFRFALDERVSYYYVGQISFEAEDSEIRQTLFLDALNQLRSKAEEAGLDVELAHTEDFELLVSVSLCPGSGQAGIVFDKDVIRYWSRYNADFYVDSLT